MTLSIERARSRKPVTWLTILGILLLPAAVGGILVGALQNPAERLGAMTAAIVNLDEPVTVDGQLAPLGRQLAAGLVEGSDELDSNLTWVISNEQDAVDGLADGSYQAVVTIPEDFSAAATSGGQAIAEGGSAAASRAERATISVTTPDDGLVADILITGRIADVAASTMGTTLSEATLENLLIGYTTIGNRIGEAATSALELANGTRDTATGATESAEGANRLSSGAAELGAGASTLAGGLDTIVGKTREASAGAAQIGVGLADGAAALQQNVGGMQHLAYAIGTGTGAAQTAAAQTQSFAQDLGTLAAACDPLTAGPDLCTRLAAAAAKAVEAAASAGTASGYLTPAAPGVAALPGTLGALSAQMSQAGAGATQLADELNLLASEGIGRSAAGARGLADGASRIAAGAADLAEGATTLSNALGTLAIGTTDLASGLRTASDSLPSFSDAESASLASVIANPVSTEAPANTIFGPTAIPLLAAVVLWFGGLASFVAMRAYTTRTLTSRRSSAGLMLRAFAPAALVGAGQGVLVALVVQTVAVYDAAAWWSFAGVAVLTGVVFAAVHQALIALFGGTGRWIGAVAGILAVATGLISTVPGWLAALGAALPTAPAFAGLIAANVTAKAGLIAWGVLSLIATTVAVALRRTTSTKAVLAAA